MTGLDTNIVLRYLLQDDPRQSPLANRVVEGQLTTENPGFINIVAILEIVWVLRSLLKRTPAEIAAHLEQLLAADTLNVQNENQVFEAAFALKCGTGEFEDVLLGAIDAWKGCAHTLTLDRRTLRSPHFQLVQ